jgi:tetratricopeptide (TPR) repeat protein
MNRDNVLFTICGLLAGFIGGYFVAGGGPRGASPASVPAAAVAEQPSAAGTGGPTPETLQRIQSLEAAAVKEPQNLAIQAELGNAYYDASEWARAAECYEKALPQRTSDANLLTDLGSCYRNLGKFDRALELYERAQKADPKHAQSLLNSALVYIFDLKNADKAQAVLDRLKKEHSEIPRLNDLQMQISTLRAAKS